MKNWLLGTMVLVAFMCQRCAVSNAKLFQDVVPTDDKTYGYTEKNPVNVKNGGLESSIDASYYYISRLRTERGEKLKVLTRKSKPASGFKEYPMQPYSRRTGMPIGSGGGEIIDFYTLVTEDGRDTISLYLNAYRKGPAKIPAGLVFEK